MLQVKNYHLCFLFFLFFSAHTQWTHFLCPTEAAALAYQPVTTSQLGLASTRYGSNSGGYNSRSSAQSTPFPYPASNPFPPTTSHHKLPHFQARPLAAYGQVLRPSIQVAGPPTMYLTQPIQIQQIDRLGYGRGASTSFPAERLPEYFQESYSSSPQYQQQTSFIF